MAKMDLGRFLETAGAMFVGQRQGELQGQELLRQQQQQDYQQQVSALNLRKQYEQEARERAFDPYKLALQYTKGLGPEGVAALSGAAGARMDQAARDPFAGSGLDTSRLPANVRPFFAPGPAPAAPPPQPVTPQADPAEVHRQTTLRALQGIAGLLPGGKAVVDALQTAPPEQASAAMGNPYTPPQTVTYPGLGPGGQPLTVPLTGGISDKDKSLLQREAKNAYSVSSNIPPTHPNAGRVRDLLALADRVDTSTPDGLNEAMGYYRQVQALGAGTGPRARNPAEIAADTKLLMDAPQRLRGTRLNENTIGGVLAQMDNAVKMEERLNTERQAIGRPAVSTAWGGLKDKVNGAISAYQQGNVPEAMRLAGQVMDATAATQMKPEERTRALQGFFAQVSKTDPSELSNEKVLSLAGAFGVRDQVEEMVRSGANFASGPAADRLRKLLPQVKNFADLDDASQKLLIDQMIPLARLSGQKLEIPARFVKEMSPAQKDASARGWANVKLSGERVDIARASLELARANFRRLEAETRMKLQGRATGELSDSAAMNLLQRTATEYRRTYDRLLTDTGMSGVFNPKRPGNDPISRQLKQAWDDYQQRLEAVGSMAKQLRRPVDIQTGKFLGPGGRVPGPSVETTTRVRTSAPAPADSRDRLAEVEARLRVLKARRGK